MAEFENQPELTILMPCLNEAETLASCINKAFYFLHENNISGEILIADNGSTDDSQKIAKELKTRVVEIPEQGYGAALIGGCNAAKGKYVIMGDADDSYDFTNLMPFLERLRSGDDLVIGNRFKGGIKKGAMPFLHKYLGNPVLSVLGRLFFNCPIRDFHCGLRGYNTNRLRELELRTTGMEYASEMIVKAKINGYKISEIPTTLSPDGRSEQPHLRSWHDGWRHLKFLLIHSPNWLFLYPGFFLVIIGLILGIFIEISPVNFFGVFLDLNTLLYAAAMVILGFNLIFFHVYTKIYAIQARFIKVKKGILFNLTTENCALFGLIGIFVGVIISVAAFIMWGIKSFGTLDPEKFMRLTIPAMTLILVGAQLLFSGFFIDILKINIKEN